MHEIGVLTCFKVGLSRLLFLYFRIFIAVSTLVNVWQKFTRNGNEPGPSSIVSDHCANCRHHIKCPNIVMVLRLLRFRFLNRIAAPSFSAVLDILLLAAFCAKKYLFGHSKNNFSIVSIRKFELSEIN